MSDLERLFACQNKTARWRAERENATARYELAQADEAMAFLLSQHEPVHTLGIDRNALRVLFAFVKHHDKHRLERELAELKGATP